MFVLNNHFSYRARDGARDKPVSEGIVNLRLRVVVVQYCWVEYVAERNLRNERVYIGIVVPCNDKAFYTSMRAAFGYSYLHGCHHSVLDELICVNRKATYLVAILVLEHNLSVSALGNNLGIRSNGTKLANLSVYILCEASHLCVTVLPVERYDAARTFYATASDVVVARKGRNPSVHVFRKARHLRGITFKGLKRDDTAIRIYVSADYHVVF